MTRTPPPARGGIAGLAFVFCLAAGAAGAGFDLALEPRQVFWLGAQPGAAAAMGAGAAVFAIVSARIARVLLGRPAPRTPAEGSRDAGDHA
jgi:hypothetical protein